METDEPIEPLIEFLGTLGVATGDVPDSPGEASRMAADAVIARDDALSLNGVAARCDLEPELVIEVFRHLGITVDDPEQVRFDDADVDLVRFLAAAREMLTDEEGPNLLHVLGTALEAASEAAVAGHVQGPESRTASWLENAQLNAAMAEVGLVLGSHLAAMFRHHLRQSAHRQRRIQSEEFREVHELSIGFVDMVGFTSLSQTLSPAEIVSLITEFETQAHELAHEHRVRVVKMIGDEVMFAGESRASSARFALGMIDAFASTEVVPRGGIAAGSIVSVHGDYFGPIVNLAARLVDIAVPGEILIDNIVAGGEGIATEPAGRRMLKGFDEPVSVHTLLPFG